jgi:hypothetical protein
MQKLNENMNHKAAETIPATRQILSKRGLVVGEFLLKRQKLSKLHT